MRPRPAMQVRIGIVAAALLVIAVVAAAVTPDPFFRERVFATAIDNVDAVTPGVPVYFAGGAVGKVRAIRLDPKADLYTVTIGLRRDWTPPACSVVTVAASNPLTAPRIDVVAPSLQAAPELAASPQRCAAFRQAQACSVLPRLPARQPWLDGCARQGDLTQLAAVTVAQAGRTLAEGQKLLTQLGTLTGANGGKVDLAALAQNAVGVSAKLDVLTSKLDATLTPSAQADIRATLANVRHTTGGAAGMNFVALQTTVTRTNALLKETSALLEENRGDLHAMASSSAGLAGDTREMLGTLQRSVTAASGDLERTSANLEALTSRLNGDPGYALRGAAYRDPPPPARP